MQEARKPREADDEPYVQTPWFPVDNAATLYAAARRKNWCRTHRIALVLDRALDPQTLQSALADTAERLPSFCAKLRDGLFWSYFEHSDDIPRALEESEYPYRSVRLADDRQPCFRILYSVSRLTIETFHGLSDGGGALIFLSTLLGRYLELQGETIPKSNLVLDVSDKPRRAEVRDSYYQYAQASRAIPKQKPRAAYIDDQSAIPGFSQLLHGIFSAQEVKAAAEKYGLSITEYLTAALIHMYIRCADAPITKPLVVSLPIDLRRRFPSDSVRNFAYMTDVSFSPNGRTDIPFAEIADSVRGVFAQKATTEKLLGHISNNVRSASSILTAAVPYPLKRLVLKRSYRLSQESSSLFFSNLGRLDLPEALRRHILLAVPCLGDSPYLQFGCSAASVNGRFCFTFSSSNRDTRKQQFFFSFLAAEGVRVRVESNTPSRRDTHPDKRCPRCDIDLGDGYTQCPLCGGDASDGAPRSTEIKTVPYPDCAAPPPIKKRHTHFPQKYVLRVVLALTVGFGVAALAGYEPLWSAGVPLLLSCCACVYLISGCLEKGALLHSAVALLSLLAVQLLLLPVSTLVSCGVAGMSLSLLPTAAALLLLLCLRRNRFIEQLRATFRIKMNNK